MAMRIQFKYVQIAPGARDLPDPLTMYDQTVALSLFLCFRKSVMFSCCWGSVMAVTPDYQQLQPPSTPFLPHPSGGLLIVGHATHPARLCHLQT